MKKVISGLGFFAALLLSHGSAAITIDDAREWYEKGGELQSTLLTYLSGQENGLSWANSYLKQQGRDPFYCLPGKLELGYCLPTPFQDPIPIPTPLRQKALVGWWIVFFASWVFQF